MISIRMMMLSAEIVFATLYSSHAFSTTTPIRGKIRGRVTTSHSFPIVYAQSNDEVTAAVDGKNTTDSSREKAAVIFLHGLGDSPDGWASLTEALPELRPSLAQLDITYVFPPAQMVAITVNGGEKMPGRFGAPDHYIYYLTTDTKFLTLLFFLSIQAGLMCSIGLSEWMQKMIPRGWQCQ